MVLAFRRSNGGFGRRGMIELAEVMSANLHLAAVVRRLSRRPKLISRLA
jgi:hypothetical protein